MATGRVIDRDRGFKAFKRRLGQADDLRVVVGYVDSRIATYAAANEYGTEHIPSRPFMRSTADSNADKYAAELQRLMERVIVTGKGTPVGALTRVGLMHRNDLIKAITSWTSPPNAPATIERKGTDAPLRDTGTMQRAIAVEVRSGGI
jgi:hypothetical protein